MAPTLLRLLALALALCQGSCTEAQLDELIRLHTFTHGLANFSSYGCHCGPGTQGAPMDKIDKCCHSHDCCYNKAQVFGCTPGSHTYRYLNLGTKVKCGYAVLNQTLPSIQFIFHKEVKTRDRCEKMMCECDNKMAKCFRKYLPMYNPQLQSLPEAPCYGIRPFC
ncbi:phospholipase A2 homolog otoconin-22-like [Sarcophilus harrisii]|uniref:phospholipase A2 homolog otoconin-22-like n=1 Tax=Sarcophilus harrisii TaxID=9305 RepID=UPI001301BD49|nr:phospholipase A2 homolog otoconin-22-like [Sarcophilus harrisii]